MNDFESFKNAIREVEEKLGSELSMTPREGGWLVTWDTFLGGRRKKSQIFLEEAFSPLRERSTLFSR